MGNLQRAIAAINEAQDQLSETQVTEIKAVKAIYVKAALSLPGAAGFSVTNRTIQRWTSEHEHINVKIGTVVMAAGSLARVSPGHIASALVHEGVHMIHKEVGTPANERRAYFEQYKSLPPFHVTRGEGAFIKAQCGENCY